MSATFHRSIVGSAAIVLLFSVAFFELELFALGPVTITTAELAMIVLALVFLPQAVVKRDRAALGGWVTAGMIAFAASLALSAIACEHYREPAMKYAARFFGWTVLYASLVAAMREPKRRLLAQRTLAFAAGTIAIIGIVEHHKYEWVLFALEPFRSNIFVGTPPPLFFSSSVLLGADGELVVRAASVFLHANILGYFLALAIPLVVAGYRFPKDRDNLWVWALCFSACGYALVLTFSRGAFVALALPATATLLAASGGLFGSVPDWVRRTRGPMIALLIVATILVFAWRFAGVGPGDHEAASEGEAAEIAETAAPQGVGTESRLLLWRAAARMGAEHPLLGVGPDQFRLLFWKFLPDVNEDLSINKGIHRAHNLAFQVFAEQGVVGLAAFAFLAWAVFSTFVRGFRRAQPGWEKAGLTAGVFAIGVGSLFDTLLYSHALVILVLTIVASWQAIATDSEGDPEWAE